VSTAKPVFVIAFRSVLLPALLSLITFGCTDGGSAPADPPVDSGTGTATLEWLQPSSNEDGSALTDLAGYKVYYGRQAYTFEQVVDVRGAAVSKAEIQNLAHGTWYFAIASYNAAGVECARSGVVSTTL
jgi:hypothetical protein